MVPTVLLTGYQLGTNGCVHHSLLRGAASFPSITGYLPATKLAVEPLGRALVGVVLVLAAVVLVVHVLGVLLRLVLGLLAVEVVLALGLGELVNLGGSEARKELLGEGVVDLLACCCGSVWYLMVVYDETLTLLALVILESLEAGESGTTGNHLMAEAGLVLLAALVHLLVGIVRLA